MVLRETEVVCDKSDERTGVLRITKCEVEKEAVGEEDTLHCEEQRRTSQTGEHDEGPTNEVRPFSKC